MHRHTSRHVRRAFAAVAAGCALAAFAASATDIVILSKSELEFPREAVQAGAERGHVKARLTIDQGGEVTRVEILEAQPRRLFDRAVTKSLSQWRFNPGTDGRHYEIDVDFKR